MLRRPLYALALLFWLPLLAQASTPLVTAEWLQENLGRPGLRILDLLPFETYRKVHIPGSVNSDYSQWRTVSREGVPGVLPEIDYLEQLVGGLGIGDDTQVVIAPPGQSAGDVAMATRIYWTLKLLGHDEVSILDGGLIGWANDRGFPLERGVVRPVRADFKANYRAADHPGAREVLDALKRGVSMVDARSPEEFSGEVSGGPKERPGRIPGAVNLPYDSLLKPGGGYFPTVEALQALFREAGAPTEGEQIAYCHTGHRASLNWFVAHELLGNDKALFYDGSMAEWALDPDLPLEK